MASQSYALEARGLTKTYRTSAGAEAHALHDLTLRIPAGQVLGIVGAAGAGKTVLLKLLGGHEAATAGSALVAGQQLQPDAALAQQQIALALTQTPPQGQQQPPWAAIAQGAGQGAAHHEAVQRYLHDLEIDPSCQRPFSAFPQPMQHMLLLAQALAAQTPILLLDEPATALDAPLAALAEAWILAHARACNPTIVLASRRLGIIRRLCDRVILLHHGQQVADLPALDLATLLEGGWYSIQIQGHLDAHWTDWFGQLLIQHEAAGRTLLVGRVADQAALHGVLNKIYDLGLPLLAVTRGEPDAEQLCTHLQQHERSATTDLRNKE